MKTSIKLALASAGALMLAATGALAADIPSNGNGSLLLVVRDLSNSSRLYVSDIGLHVDDILTQAAIDATPGTDASLRNGVPIQNIATNFSDISNAGLGTFMQTTSALGYEYALIGGDWVGTTARADAWRWVGTGEIQYQVGTVSPLTGALLGGASGLFASGGDQFFIDFNQEQVGGAATTLPIGTMSQFWGAMSDLNPDTFAAVGTATNLYVWTSMGSNTGRAGVYQANDIRLLSSGTLLGGQAASVPVPAAIWLLGSGLAGMGAVSRRRKAAKADKSAQAAV